MIRAFVFVACALLAACASNPPPYVAAGAPGAAGYSERQIESDRYFVTYRAEGSAEASLLQDYALLRAAELTLQQGRDWFWVDRSTLDDQDARRSGPSIGVGIGGGSWGSRSGASVGVGMNFPLGGGQGQTARAATVEIRLGEGPKPDDPNAYDARSIAQTIRTRLTP